MRLRHALIALLFCVSMLPSQPEAVVNQINGVVVPILSGTCPGAVDKCLQTGLNYGEGINPPNAPPTLPGPVNAILDANTGPETFLVPKVGANFVNVTFRLMQEGAGYENIFGWYNVGEPNKRYPTIFSCRGGSNAAYEPPYYSGPNLTGGYSTTVDFQAEFAAGRYQGKQIGFYLISPEGGVNPHNSCATDPDDLGTLASGGPIDDDGFPEGDGHDDDDGFGRIYFTESKLNNDGNYVHYLIYQSKANVQHYYFGFEDLFRGGDNDYDDTFVKVQGLVPTCQPTQEICNGVDDNCNGQVDENLFRSCSTACGVGQETCKFTNDGNAANDWIGCTAPLPKTETCNGIDDDCDGTPDNNLPPLGACSSSGCTGTYVCTGGKQVCNAPSPSNEVCNGIDDDCDGKIDNGVTRPCSTACGTGVESCLFTNDGNASNDWVNCTATKPVAETCNGLDDDCDGQFDEGLPLGGSCTNNGCTGNFVCVGGKDVCNAPAPTTEICDGKDNNCNGQTDEGVTRPCSSVCGTGTETCLFTNDGNPANDWVGCTATRPVAETCNGKDDDCDGQIDEGLPPGGACANQGCTGQLVCTNGAMVCNAPAPVQEICDGKDNDCDGQIDEGITRPCSSICGTGTETCSFTNDGNAANDWVGCNAPAPTAEICDGKDNDCDGQTDEGVPPGGACANQGCTGQLMCANGKMVCNAPAPTQEVCDGKDNNCNGQIDEGVTRPCSSVCGTGVETCLFTNDGNAQNDWIGCNAPTPTAEICDGKDNNCNGQIDEGLGSGGACSNQGCTGQLFCVNGKMACNAPAPTQEVCDGKDNDCDGQIDEGVTQPCSTACGTGTETCLFTNDGNPVNDWIGCTAPTPTVEICDGKDNDCDGQIDEDLPAGGACTNQGCLGQLVCASGKMVCNAPSPTQEVCDGLDNNCNGTVDEGVTRPCSSECGVGSETCQFTNDGNPENDWINCSAQKPGIEVCNGLDDDCNGKIDDGLVAGRDCTVGACSGKMVCIGGKMSCDAPSPVAESCDGKDNNCNGQIDENLTRACTSACGFGVETCKFTDDGDDTNNWAGCTAPSPVAEVCDGLDNDCDGVVDNGVPGEGTACDHPSGNTCSKGQTKCVGGKMTCVGATKGSAEICDCKDNDCDGQIDEDVTCPGASKCKNCGCRIPCAGVEFGCPSSFACVDGFCIPDKCAGVNCKTDERCENGLCISVCAGVNCPADKMCSGGVCMDKTCYGTGCAQGELCLTGTCQKDPCAGVSCQSGEFCTNGACRPSCGPKVCGERSVCKEGKCSDDPCAAVTCNFGVACVDGRCDTDCEGKYCQTGQVCQLGKCVDNPCATVKCFAPGERCVAGQCITDSTYIGHRSELLATGAGGFACALSQGPGARGGAAGSGAQIVLLLSLALLGILRRRGGKA